MAKTKEVVAEEVKETSKGYSLYAWFAYVDKDGYRTKSEYHSEGKTAEELLNSLDFPKGVNRLVNITIKHGDEELSKALAPHKARSILEHKSVFDFNATFRGL